MRAPRPILSTDDLVGVSDADLRAAKAALNIRERVVGRVAAMGKRVGLTRAEYVKQMLERKPEPCTHCDGTGKFLPEAPREVGVVHPSAAHRCVLRNFYDVTGLIAGQETIKWEMQVTFEIGHTLHRMVQNALVLELGDQFRPEAKALIGDLIAGNTDGDIWTPQAHAVLEIKSMGSEFAGLREPKKDHQLQANGMYATALDAPFVVFLYVSKEWPYPIKEYVVEHDPKIFAHWMRNKGDKIQKALETGDEPVADADASECLECPYSHACKQKIVKTRANAFKHKVV